MTPTPQDAPLSDEVLRALARSPAYIYKAADSGTMYAQVPECIVPAAETMQQIAADLLDLRAKVREWTSAGDAWLAAGAHTTDAEYAAMRERDGKACGALRDYLAQLDGVRDGV